MTAPEPLSADDAFRAIREAAEGEAFLKRGTLDRDDFGDARFRVRLARVSHLDADALSDRLHAWIHREVEEALPGASALVSFDHARPATAEDGGLDVGNDWVGIEAHLTLDLQRPRPTAEAARAWVARIPEFLALVEAKGRPKDWRDHSTGMVE